MSEPSFWDYSPAERKVWATGFIGGLIVGLILGLAVIPTVLGK